MIIPPAQQIHTHAHTNARMDARIRRRVKSFHIHTITLHRETMTTEGGSIVNIEKYRAIYVVDGITSG